MPVMLRVLEDAGLVVRDLGVRLEEGHQNDTRRLLPQVHAPIPESTMHTDWPELHHMYVRGATDLRLHGKCEEC